MSAFCYTHTTKGKFRIIHIIQAISIKNVHSLSQSKTYQKIIKHYKKLSKHQIHLFIY